jgi:hypothetical protein
MFCLTIDYTETFCITLSSVMMIYGNFRHITPFWNDLKKLSVYYAQKRVSQISVPQTTSFEQNINNEIKSPTSLAPILRSPLRTELK